MKRHANLSIFVAHIGCPHRCAFCNQTEINGATDQPTPESVAELCARYLPADGENTEIAFFGGSFTAIERGYMIALLDAAHEFVKAGRACGIRLSTRPDAIDDEVLAILTARGVSAIELGAQSMDDAVLKKNSRGHTADDVRRASALIKQAGFSLGLQMMIGMYGEDDYEKGAEYTAGQIIELGPDCVRIYPTLTLRNTALCNLYERGEYRPLELERAVDITAGLLFRFRDRGITVIRTGLHDDPALRDNLVAGPYHPAFGELCMSRLMRMDLECLLDGERGEITVEVPRKQLSAMIGQKRENIDYFRRCGVILRVVGGDTPKIRISGR